MYWNISVNCSAVEKKLNQALWTREISYLSACRAQPDLRAERQKCFVELVNVMVNFKNRRD